MPGNRRKQAERNEECEGIVANAHIVIGARACNPKRIPQLLWLECIRKILIHLNSYDARSNQRAPLIPEMDYDEHDKIVVYDGGWPEYEEAVFYCWRSRSVFDGHFCSKMGLIGTSRAL